MVLIDLFLQLIIVQAQRERFEDFVRFEQHFFEVNFVNRMFGNSWHQPQAPPPPPPNSWHQPQAPPPPTYDRSSTPYAQPQSPSYSPGPRSPSPFVPNREEFGDDNSTIDFNYEEYQANRDSDDDVQVIESSDEDGEVEIVETQEVDLLLNNNGERVMVNPNPSVKLPICVICLSSWMENRPLMAPCGHIFCGPCLRNEFDYRKRCPNCKKGIANFNKCSPCFP